MPQFSQSLTVLQSGCEIDYLEVAEVDCFRDAKVNSCLKSQLTLWRLCILVDDLNS